MIGQLEINLGCEVVGGAGVVILSLILSLTLFGRILVKFLSFVWNKLDSLAMSSLVLGAAVGAARTESSMLSSPSSPIRSLTGLALVTHTTLSGQLQIFRIGSNWRLPGQLWSLGLPCAHL